MEYKIAGAGGKLLLKHLSILNLIGGSYLNPSSILLLPGLGGLMLKERFLDQNPKFSNTVAFMVKQQRMNFTDHFAKLGTEIRKEGEDTTQFKFHHLLNREIEMRFSVGSVGKTSAVSQSAIIDLTDDRTLAIGSQFFVFMNKLRGNKMPIPGDIRKILDAEKLNTPMQFLFDQCLNIPDDPCQGHHTTRVGMSDVGPSGYMSHHQYLSHCLDCLAKHISKNVIQHMPGIIWEYQVRSCQFSYMKPSLLGDTLRVSYWNDTKDIWRFYFRFQKEEKVVCEASMEMMPSY